MRERARTLWDALRWLYIGVCLISVALAALWGALGFFESPLGGAAQSERLRLARKLKVVTRGFTTGGVATALGRPEEVYRSEEVGHSFPVPYYSWDGWRPTGPTWVYRSEGRAGLGYVYFGPDGRVHHTYVARGPFS
jgi:hypothetical protein